MKMSEVTAVREYRITPKSPKQTKVIIEEVTTLLKESVSPRVCEVGLKVNPRDSSRFTVKMVCADGKSVYYVDLRTMFRILQLCEKIGIPHEVGDLQVLLDS